MPRPASLRIRLMGPLEVDLAGRPIVVDTLKALAIVALVAAEARPFARDELAAMFWPDATDEAARGAVTGLGRVMGSGRRRCPGRDRHRADTCRR